MQLQGATKLERELYDVCIVCEETMPASEFETRLVVALSNASNELQRLRNLIGEPSAGSHPDEALPRDKSWHGERRNWEAEVRSLRQNNTEMRQALLPFAAAAGRPGRLLDDVGNPLPEDAVLGLGVKAFAWRHAITLTGAE
jgi:hypothetical protein